MGHPLARFGGDVRFGPQAALNLWPAREPEITPEKLPAWLTTIETVAWVMTRDAQVVTWASPENPRKSSHQEEHRLPDGSVRMIEMPTEGINTLWLQLYCLSKDGALPPCPITDPEVAIAQIVEALRGDLLLGRADPRGRNRRDMTADDWRERTLGEIDDHGTVLDPVMLFPGGSGPWYDRAWSKLRFPRDVVLKLWPSTKMASATASARLPLAISESPTSAQTDNEPPPTKSVGGRLPQYDWDAFYREAVRIANLDGFATRREMAGHLRAWITANWTKQPDERTIQRRLAKLYPSDLPER